MKSNVSMLVVEHRYSLEKLFSEEFGNHEYHDRFENAASTQQIDDRVICGSDNLRDEVKEHPFDSTKKDPNKRNVDGLEARKLDFY